MSSASYFELLDRFTRESARLITLPPDDVAVEELPEDSSVEVQEARNALVIDGLDKTFITVPVESASLKAEDFVTRISGRLVGADEPNRNKQFWTTADLQFGLGSVGGGPLNWLHDERHIVGALTNGELVAGKAQPVAGKEQQKQAAAAARYSGTHIKADSVLWSYIFPAETRIVEQAARDGKLYYSMECISKKVQCAGETGCGHEMDYADAVGRTERACAHIRDRASARRFVNPVFQGAALIIPPVKPGWTNANADIVKRAAASEEVQQFADGDIALAAQILAFVGGQ